jgi:hypothetical protein
MSVQELKDVFMCSIRKMKQAVHMVISLNLIVKIGQLLLR